MLISKSLTFQLMLLLWPILRLRIVYIWVLAGFNEKINILDHIAVAIWINLIVFWSWKLLCKYNAISNWAYFYLPVFATIIVGVGIQYSFWVEYDVFHLLVLENPMNIITPVFSVLLFFYKKKKG